MRTRLPTKQAFHDAEPFCCCHQVGAAAAAAAGTGGLDVALQQVHKCDRVGQPVSQAGEIVLLYLAANDLQANKPHSTAACQATLEALPVLRAHSSACWKIPAYNQ
jgi:hypothetical protein